MFFHYGSQNLLPKQFVIHAGYGDLAVGLLVPIILMLKRGDRKYLLFHIFGLLDFIVAVGTGLTFNFILHDPLMRNITTFPILFIPLYGVCVTGSLSIMTLDILLKRRFRLQATSSWQAIFEAIVDNLLLVSRGDDEEAPNKYFFLGLFFVSFRYTYEALNLDGYIKKGFAIRVGVRAFGSLL